MVKSSAANVIDLEAFRQRKMLREERPSEDMRMASGVHPQAMVVPVWFCWVPMWPTTFG